MATKLIVTLWLFSIIVSICKLKAPAINESEELRIVPYDSVLSIMVTFGSVVDIFAFTRKASYVSETFLSLTFSFISSPKSALPLSFASSSSIVYSSKEISLAFRF